MYLQINLKFLTMTRLSKNKFCFFCTDIWKIGKYWPGGQKSIKEENLDKWKIENIFCKYLEQEM